MYLPTYWLLDISIRGPCKFFPSDVILGYLFAQIKVARCIYRIVFLFKCTWRIITDYTVNKIFLINTYFTEYYFNNIIL